MGLTGPAPIPKPPPNDEHSEPKIESTEKSARSLISRLDNFFSWISELVTEQAKQTTEEPAAIGTLALNHDISVQQETDKVIATACRIGDELEDIKNRLILEFGKSASSFIAKSIDPMILHARRLVNELGDRSSRQSAFKGALDQAIETVELYAAYSDEKKLKNKIITEGVGQTKAAIEKDIQLLLHYQIQACEEIMLLPDKQKLMKEELESCLQPILIEIQRHAQQTPEFKDLHEFFIWKRTIDESRNALTELGYLTIESIVSRIGPLSEPNIGQESMQSGKDELFFAPLLEKNIEEQSLILSQMAQLEESTLAVLEILEQKKPLDGITLYELSVTLSKIRNQTDALGNSIYYSSSIHDGYQDLHDTILRAEALLQKRQQESFYGEI